MSKQSTSNTAQAMWIGIGSLFSFLFAIVSSAILSRYLTKTEYGKVIDLEQYTKDGRLTEPSDGKIFDYRNMFEVVKSLARPLTETSNSIKILIKFFCFNKIIATNAIRKNGFMATATADQIRKLLFLFFKRQ